MVGSGGPRSKLLSRWQHLLPFWLFVCFWPVSPGSWLEGAWVPWRVVCVFVAYGDPGTVSPAKRAPPKFMSLVAFLFLTL